MKKILDKESISEIHLEKRDCYYCHSGEYHPYATENGYSLVKCAKCGLLFVNPAPGQSDIKNAHTSGIHHGDHLLKVSGHYNKWKIPAYLKTLNDFFSEVDLAQKKWLDVGCGHGEFIMALQQFSSNNVIVTGHEPNAFKRRQANKRGLRVDNFDLDSHKIKYDAISLLNVYSHLPDPTKTIGSLKRLLNPNGLLFIQTGDTAGFDSDKHPRPLLLPDHLSFASEQIATGILKDKGFKVLRVQKYPFVVPRMINLLKETAKVFWPGKPSNLRSYFKYKLYNEAVMCILAQVG